MEKILSICVPSYNMEQFIARNIESFLVPECIDKIEVIVVNDGSKDDTLRIANYYKEKYPNTVVVVDKINGHYGSCINAALKVAIGKYFRIVDADDWVNPDSLKTIIYEMAMIDSDCFYTRYVTVTDEVMNKVGEDLALPYGSISDIDSIKIPSECLAMHSLSYKTSFLREMDYYQTEGICYTDIEYVFYPLMKCDTIYWSDSYLYCYMLGRDGQSMSPVSIMKNFSHFRLLIDKLQSYYSIEKIVPNRKYIYDHFIYHLSLNIIRIALVYNPKTEYKSYLRTLIDTIEETTVKKFNKICIKGIPYFRMWFRNSVLDRVVLDILVLGFKLKIKKEIWNH